MSTTELVKLLKSLEFYGDVEDFVQTCDEDEIEDLIRTLAGASDRVFDMRELDALAPVALPDFLKVNEECPPCSEELLALLTAPIGGEVKLGIGGGYVTVRRLS